MSPPQLLGRERELRRIGDLLNRVADQGGSLVVRGEAGIGKSALLQEVGRRATSRGMNVLSTTGVRSEAQLAYAGLHQLLQPLISEIDELPAPQRDAMSSAFGMSEGATGDVFLIGLAALNLLADKAADAPLLVVVEDAHWLDEATCDVLAFVARRLELEPIVVLFAAPDDLDSSLQEAELPELQLEGLEPADARALLDQHAPDLAQDLRQRVIETAGGNPLALVELPHSLNLDELDAAVPLMPLPITERLERAFSGRAAELRSATRTLLLVAALDERASLRELLSAASRINGEPTTAEDVRPAVVAHLIELHPDGLRFRHPLVRSAIYQAAPLADRQAAHSALAETYAGDLDRSVWHHAASLPGPDERVAGELEAAAERALRRGAPPVAAAALERAAQLTPDGAARLALLLRAAELEFELGRAERSARLLSEAAPLELGSRERTRLSFLSEVFEEGSWTGATRVASFVKIADDLAAAGDVHGALTTLQMIAQRCWWGNPDQETRDRVVTAAMRLPLPPDFPPLITLLALADPVKYGAWVIERVSAVAPEDERDPIELLVLGNGASAVWAYDLALPFLSAAVDGLRAQGRLGLLVQTLVHQSWAAVHLARETVAVAAAEEALRLAHGTGQLRWAMSAKLARATIAGERGDRALADSLTTEAEAVLLPTGAHELLSLVQFARGRVAVAHQDYAAGYDHLARIMDPADVAHNPFVGACALADLIEAALQIGKEDRARQHLAELEHLAAITSGPLLQAELGYARPLLASDDDAEELYQTAIGGDLTSWPWYRGRALLWCGRWLRRQRRVAESRAPLRSARELFDALRFPGLADAARQELRASGETSRVRAPEAWAQLTPQELQIAQLAAAGLSNREIGQRLYVSHRTVGSHLYRMFPKLGISSRSQLRDALAGAATAA